MQQYIERKANRVSVKQAESLYALLRGEMPSFNKSLSKLFKEMDAEIKQAYPSVSSGALNNVHGRWYETIISIASWQMASSESRGHILLPIPNASQFDVWSLYSDKYHGYIEDLRSKVLDATGSKLITSNPDFVILNKRVLGDILPLFEDGFDITSVNKMTNSYKDCVGKCEFEDIKGFLSVKTSMRPDRRLQVCHEGAMVKSLYSHIRTREWVINAKGLKYYAASTKLSDADRDALKSVAGHSLANVQGLPEPSVDHSFSLDSVSDIYRMASELLA